MEGRVIGNKLRAFGHKLNYLFLLWREMGKDIKGVHAPLEHTGKFRY